MVVKAILMDFNGVVINDEPLQMKAYQDVLKGHGVELTEADYYASLGMDDRTFTAAAFERAGKAATAEQIDEVAAGKTSKWREFVADELPLFDGVSDFIERMSREFSLGLVSMAKRAEIEHVLTRSGLDRFFDTVITAEDVANCKPDPECFRIGFKELDAVRTAKGHSPMTHSECLVIEDSPPGIAGAVSAGLPALGVSNTVSAAELRAAGAGAVAADLRDWMPASIERVFGR